MPDHSPIEAMLALREVERLLSSSERAFPSRKQLLVARAELLFHAGRLEREVRAQTEVEYEHLEMLRVDYRHAAETIEWLLGLAVSKVVVWLLDTTPDLIEERVRRLTGAGRVSGVLANYIQGRLERTGRPEPLTGVEDGVASPVVEEVD